jgi:hypothetical protein
MANSPTDTEVQTEDPHTSVPENQPGRDSSAGVKQTADQVKQDARNAIDQTKQQAVSMLSEQKRAAAGQIEGFAKALRKTVEELNAQDRQPAARYVDQAADGLDRLSHSLRNQDIDALKTQVQDFARRKPGAFLGGAVAAGFLMARFLKSSSRSGGLHENNQSPVSTGATTDTTGAVNTSV